MYHNPQAVVQVNRKRSEAFTINQPVRQGCPLSPLFYVLTLEPLLRKLTDGKASPALCGIPPADPLSTKVSAYADDITVFVSRRLDIMAVKKAVVRYKQIAGAKINFDKSKGLQLGAKKGGVSQPGSFRWSDGPIHIRGVWFGIGLQLERNWSEVDAQMGTSLRRQLSLKGMAGGVRCTSSPWSFTACLYFFCLRIIGWHFNDPSPNYFGEAEGRWFVDRSVLNIHVTEV